MIPNTKIVCTLGTSSWTPEVLKKLIDNGMTVARLNGAFVTIEDMKVIAQNVRSVSRDVALMIDIKGHELRLNRFAEDVIVKPGDEFIIGTPTDPIYCQTFPELYKSLSVGNQLLINDGNVVIEVEKIENEKIYTRVLVGNKIASGKGINTPGVYIDNPPMTDKDKEQIQFALEDKWDFVAGSFIRSAEDVRLIKELLSGTHAKFIAKIEDGFGIKNIDEIIEESEGIMVARGDMGVEIPYYRVPHVQKMIIKKCNDAIKPVIVATQMLESMIHSPRPTRAEVSDVANAIEDGTDAIMLSGETTIGDYPVQCVNVMKEIALETESFIYNNFPHIQNSNILCKTKDEGTEIAMAIAKSVATLSYQMENAKIIVDTKTGFSAKLIASYNLKNNIIAITPYDYYARRVALSKGIKSITRQPDTEFKNITELQNHLIEISKEKGYIKIGDTVIMCIASSYNLLSASHEKAKIKIITI